MSGRSHAEGDRAGWGAKILAVVVATLVALALVELLVRLVAPMPPAFSWMRPDGLVLHKPGMEAVVRRPEFETRVRINRAGLRGPDFEPVKKPGTLRILMLGDSYVEGMQVAEEELISTRLAKLLGERSGRSLEVINAGVSGYGTADEILLLDKLGWQLRPDIVVVGFCIHNDVENNLQRPLYDFSSWPPRSKEAPPPGGRELLFLRIKEFLSRRSQFYQLLRDRLSGTRLFDQGLRSWGVRREQGNTVEKGAPGLELAPKDWFVDPLPAGLARGVDYTRLLFRWLLEQSATRGARLVVFWIPLREQVEDERWAALRTAPGMAAARRSRPQEILGQIGRDLGIQEIDLLPVFLEKRGAVPLYFRLDGHWTAEGHRIAAEALAEALLGRLAD